MPNHACPSDDALLTFHLGTLPEPGLSEVADHVECCDACNGRLRRLDGRTDSVLGALRPHRPAAPMESTLLGQAPQRPGPPPDGVGRSLRQAGFEVLEELGRGGMGVVYRARESSLSREVAVKLLLPQAQYSPAATARFRAEAEAAASVQHPNVVQIFAIGEQGGRPYLVLEYVPGGSLANKLAGQPIAGREAAGLLAALADAVAAAHERGVVHRDLKPANILMTADGTPKVTDFGLAVRRDHDARLTETGCVAGTPSYMAPEQVRGLRELVGPATDIYALGAILYEMLTGRPPFLAARPHEAFDMVCHREPVPPGQLQALTPRDLQTICLRCLRKEPHKRYPSAGALAEDLRAFLDGRPIRARPQPAWERGWRLARRNPVAASLASLSAALLLAVAVGSTASAMLLRAERRQRHRAVVASLLEVRPAGVPVLLGEMSGSPDLFLPELRDRYADESLGPLGRLRLAMALAALGEPLADELVRAVATAPGGECANLVAAFRALPCRGMAELRTAHEQASGDARFRLAVVLLELGEADAARGTLTYRHDPRRRTAFVHQFAGWHGDLTALAGVLRRNEDSALRSGLCAAVGRLDPATLDPAVSAALRAVLAELHRDAPDGGTHSASGWALRRWGEKTPPLEPTTAAGRGWFVTATGLTMLRAGPSSRWPLWVSDREVSLRLFRRFLSDPSLAAADKPAGWPGPVASVCPSDDCPAHMVNLGEMILFCNWLSRREGRTPCYRSVAGRPGWWTCRVGADGYRLPSNHEWSYACRAGASTRFYHGDDAARLPEYANVIQERAEPGGHRLPNDWGLFDMFANVYEFCFDPPVLHAPFDQESAAFQVRGGGYSGAISHCDFDMKFAAARFRVPTAGFRVVFRQGVPPETDSSALHLETLGRLIEQAPGATHYRQVRADLLSWLGRGEEAAADLVAESSFDPANSRLLVQAANLYVRLGRWREARPLMCRAADAAPGDHELAFNLAALLLAAGDEAGYRLHRRRMLSRWSDTKAGQVAERTAKACSLLGADDDAQSAAVLDLARRGVRLVESAKPPSVMLGYAALAEAMAAYRCGRDDEVLARSAAALKVPGLPTYPTATAHLIRSLALRRLGRTEEARASFDQAVAVPALQPGDPAFPLAWRDLLIWQTLRREAESLLARP